MKNNAINIYDADGRLVRRSYGTLEWVTTDLGFTSHTYQAYREERRVDYVGELTLEDGAVYRRTHEAGWTDAQGREVAAVHDWRGSLRATWTDTSTGNASGGGTTAPFIPGAGANTKIYGNLTGYYPYGLPWADWQGTDRYLFSGKELEREHGLMTYDFHARPYDPGLCRFTQPDPLAAKYERLNAFTYCAANPITFTDPTGCVIKAANKETQTEMLSDLGKIYKAEFAEVDFNSSTGNLSINLRQEELPKGEAQEHIMAVDEVLQRLIADEREYIVEYVNSEFEYGGKSIVSWGGALTDVENNRIYILKDLDMEFSTDPDYSDFSIWGIPQTFRETSISALLHEAKEIDLGQAEYRGDVIDYSNHGRALLGLPLRHYDLEHSHIVKTEIQNQVR